MADDPAEDNLEHHGVKGMHWGVRRKVGPNGKVIGKSKPKQSSDYKSTAPLRKRPPSTLSNMQLKKINERQQLEQKFAKMNPTKVDKGKSFADDVLKASIGVGTIGAAFKLAQNPQVHAFVQSKLKPGKHFATEAVKAGSRLRK